MKKIQKVISLIKKSGHTTVFTGAGISVESGIPAFRGENGLWEKYDPKLLNLEYFYRHPEKSWKLLKEIYKIIKNSSPNSAHKGLAKMEKQDYVDQIITQNIDGLHKKAGSRNVYHFHGACNKLTCIECGISIKKNNINLKKLPPTCTDCGGILKPDVVFFGEDIPQPAGDLSFEEANKADMFIIIGTSGEVAPANLIPVNAKKQGAKIVEITPEATEYTNSIVDIVLFGSAGNILKKISKKLLNKK
ncbi:MAG: SIR2 family NAD-dependent protein deacylase [Nanoarchaeota archaeon]